ncbi:uncharacterized protein LOC116010064 [Ipomoea triloba]|uniref:uncharacterized protein LOC116010064 n=1 Tax=Ipomoea triloba TaxID=35885 RepID=UPI00125DAD65|nr:uncharacterized protein LOC116010064 [Ipomoea triloba]
MDPADYDLMDSALYEALVEGNQEEVDEALWSKMVTPKGNTMLHIAALYGHTHLVQKILEKHRSLLCAVNNKNETALHIAAREGHTGVVSELIRCAKARPELESGIGGARDMVRMMDGDKDTALHKAVRKGHLEVVKLVVKEDPEFEFGANEAGETPLYLAAELQFHQCLVEILNNSQRPVFDGPLGRTALHAAIIHSEPPKDSTKLLLEKEASLCEVGDDWGWTPLHYAVRLNNEKAVEQILQVKSSAAYIPAGGKEGEWTTALHIAVSEDSVVLFKQILQHCPLCWEMVDSKGRNILHEAILNDARKAIKFILNSPKMDHLVDERDEDGNTPLHLVAASNNYVPELIHHPRLSGAMVFNKQHLTPLDIASRVGSGSVGKRGDLTMKTKRNNETRMEMTQEMRVPKERSVSSAGKMAKAHIVVVALIVTVTFAAGMAVPGGYNDDNQGEKQAGMPILLRKSAFKAFVVTNAIGFVASISSLIGYIMLVEEISSFGRPKVVRKLVCFSILLLDLSLTALILAFITGMFAVLTVHSSAVAVGVCIGVSICIIGIISVLLFLGYNEHWWIVRKLFNFFNKLVLYQMDPAAASLPLGYDLMDSALYEAMVEGNEDLDEALWDKMEQHGGRQVTPKGNTILHIAALYGHTHFVQKILEKHTSLLCIVNKKNETALHIAAREGHTAVVSALICCAKARPELESGIGGARDMVRMMDGDKDTALHKAVRKGHLEVVKLVVKEDPEFEFGPNEAGETPLYLAAELQFHECLLEILNNSQRPVFDGPLGRNALHAAIIHSGGPKDSTKLLLEKEASLCEVGDDWGWTPLHYAVRLNNERAVEQILQVKSSAAYIPAGGKEGEWTTAVHIAVSEDSIVLFKQILQHCPLCWEMVDSKGQNVLHEAILNDARKVMKFILNSPKMDHLVDERDEDGDTPLHLVAASNNYVPKLIPHPRLKGTVIFNKQNLTPLDIAYQEPALVALKPILIKVGWKRGWRGDLTKKTKTNAFNNGGTSRTQMIQKRKDREEMYINSVEKVAKTHILVATLIATVTFAAGITLPGGYNNTLGETTQGMAILLGKSAFKAFVITNAIGFVCSIASLTGYMRLVGEVSDTKRLEILENVGFYSALMLDLSLTAVVLAFATGMFAVLTHSSALAVGLCISICIVVLGLISFPVFIGYKEKGLIVSKFKKYVIIKKA